MKLFDLNTKSQFFEIELNDEYIIGILASGNCCLINGHAYFNNNLVKIRYDLMKES